MLLLTGNVSLIHQYKVLLQLIYVYQAYLQLLLYQVVHISGYVIDRMVESHLTSVPLLVLMGNVQQLLPLLDRPILKLQELLLPQLQHDQTAKLLLFLLIKCVLILTVVFVII